MIIMMTCEDNCDNDNAATVFAGAVTIIDVVVGAIAIAVVVFAFAVANAVAR